MSDKLSKVERQQVILDRLTDREMDAPRLDDIMQEVGGDYDAKTIRRDLDELRRLGADIRREGNGRNTVYVLNNDFRLPNAFSADDLLSLTILRHAIKDYSGKFLEEQLDGLAKRIAGITLEQRDYSSDEIDAAISFRPPPAQPVDQSLWEAVLTAVLKKSELMFKYSGRHGGDGGITVRPYHMVCSEGEWYLLAGTPDDLMPVQYSLARMSDVEAVPGRNHFRIPEDFDAKDLLQNSFGGFFSVGPTKTVRVLISGFMVRYVKNRIFQPKQVVKEIDGGKALEISFPAVASGPVPFGNVASWVLSMGPCAKVLEPPELIARVKEEALAVVKLYGDA